MRHHAKANLKCGEIMPNVWKVWGGENSHDVTCHDGVYVCDCDNSKRNGICSHIIRVKLTQGKFPERGRYPS